MLRIAAVKSLIGRSCEYRPNFRSDFCRAFFIPKKMLISHKDVQACIGRASSDNQTEFLRSGPQVRKKSHLQVLDRNALRVRANIQGRNHSSS
jgi:hypothetical protein